MANLLAANKPFSIKSWGKSNLIGASNDLATVIITKIKTKYNLLNKEKINLPFVPKTQKIS